MNTQPSDTKTRQGPAITIAAIALAVLLVAGGSFFVSKDQPVLETVKTGKPFNEFVVVTGAVPDETVTLTLKKPNGQEIPIAERLTLDTARHVFSAEEQGHDYTLTTELRNKNDHVRSLSMTLSNDPMMIVINVVGFTPDDGLDLFVGPNSISTRTWMDWAGNLQQTIPLPLDPRGSFCLVVSDGAKVEAIRVCHELPPRKAGGLLG